MQLQIADADGCLRLDMHCIFDMIDDDLPALTTATRALSSGRAVCLSLILNSLIQFNIIGHRLLVKLFAHTHARVRLLNKIITFRYQWEYLRNNQTSVTFSVTGACVSGLSWG